jgi:hypothetical protein
MRDKPTLEMCRKIMMINHEVRYEVLKKFVAACRWLYSIAFFQWRLMKPTIDHKIKNNNKHEDLAELIDKYMEFIIPRLKKVENKI